MVKSGLQQFKEWVKGLSLDVVIPVFVLNVVLQFSDFFPTLHEINIWDEATYIYKGYLFLTQGRLPSLIGSPLSSVFYALTMLPVQHSKDFFLLSDAIGRVLLFAFIFFSAYLIAHELKPYANPWVMLALVFIVPVAVTMYLFPSDILFAGFSGLAFWQMLVFYHCRRQKHLWRASLFMGLGALARAEGLILIGVMLIVTLVMSLPDRKWYRSMLAVLVPFVAFVGGYILVYGLATGDFNTGLSKRTYNNFESGHESIYSQENVFIPTISARLESREAFGTPEMNDYSVLKAILRNPRVYWQRVRRMPFVFFNKAVKAYGNKFILIYLWLSIRGMVALVRQKHTPLLLMGVLWFLPWGTGLLNTFFREGYFMMSYFVIFAFSAIGLSAMIRNFDKKAERISLAAGGGTVILAAVLLKNTSMLYRSVLFILGLGIVYLLWFRNRDGLDWRKHAWWVLLAIGLIIRGSYNSPEWPVYGNTDKERSVYFLQDTLPVGSKVLAGAPANIWAARMIYYGINSYDIPEFAGEQAFFDWIRAQGIDAVYVDTYFPQPYLAFLPGLIEERLQEVYATPERDIIIYLVD